VHDFTVWNESGKILLRANTPRAEQWCLENLSKSDRIGEAYDISAPEIFGEIAQRLLMDGFSIEKG
jgi:hypothetical protein